MAQIRALIALAPSAAPEIEALALGDVFEVVWSDGTCGRYVNAIANVRTGGATTAFRRLACASRIATSARSWFRLSYTGHHHGNPAPAPILASCPPAR